MPCPALPCLVLSCLVVTVCVMNHHMGRGGGEAAEANVFFSWGGRGADGRGEVRTGQDREENPSISSYIHIHTRTRERDGGG